jgi:gliding motility-associated-like protein
MKLLSTYILILFSSALFSQQAGYKFLQNKNQWPENVDYKTELKNGELYLEKNGFLFNFYDGKTMDGLLANHYDKSKLPKNPSINQHAYKINFINMNKNCRIINNQPTKEYYNYFIGKDPLKWASDVKGYHQITYSDLYKGIDLKLYSKYFNLKYDLIIQAGANPKVIQFKYEGVEDVSIKKGRIHIQTSVNHIIEDEPFAFQLIDNKKVKVACEYKLKNNTISYHFPEGYNKKIPLIIDPTLIFSTYSGSFSNNFGYSATFDSKGFLYSGSSVFGNQYPTTLGAYNTSWNGGVVDIGISKFDTSGTFLIYSTYLGGSSDEVPHSLIVNSFDELFILGTTSSIDFATTSSAYDTSYNGGVPNNLANGLGVNYTNGSDIFVSYLSANGTNLLGSTYIGGSNNDGLNSTSDIASNNTLRYNYADEMRGEIEIDDNNNIYIASCTQSSDFPVTTNSFQNSYGGGDIDGCIVKLDNNLENIIWSSYLGGDLHDAIYSIALDPNQDIYVTGGTSSSTFPSSLNAIHPNNQGGRSDGFVSHLSSNGQQVLNSTFYGSTTYDQSYFVETDRNGNVYLLGQTEIQDSTFIINAGWSVLGSGQFISKLSPNLDSIFYSTVFGSGNGINISPTAFLVDLCNKMYLAGWGGSVNNLGILDNNAGFTNNMPITSDAFQSTTDGSDFYIMVLEDDASGIVYGSYFGGNTSSEHVDGGTSRFDRKGKVYQAICAGCGGNSDLPIQPSGAVSPTNNSNCNLGVFKMEFELPFVLADFDTPPLGCEPFTYSFNNTSVFQNNSVFEWDFGDGNTSNIANPSHTFTQSGTYTVKLIVSDTATCNFGDTISKEIIVMGDTSYTLQTLAICPGESQQIGFLPNADTSITYSWFPSIDLTNDSISNPFSNTLNTTTYSLYISNGICVDTAFQTIQVNTPLLNIPNDTVLCDGGSSISIVANSYGTSNEFIWSLSPAFNDTINSSLSDSVITVSPNSTTSYYIQTNNNGCYIADTILIEVSIGNFSISSDTLQCIGDSILAIAETNTSIDSIDIEFSPANFALNPVFNDSVWFTILNDTYISATAFDPSTGCIQKDSIWITLDSLPVITPSVTADFLVISPGNSTNLYVTPNGYNYEWSPSNSLNNSNAQNPIASPLTNTTYYVVISNGFCEKNDSITILVNELTCGPPEIFIPSAFSPNEDNSNDILRVRGNYISNENFVFRVFNRLGNLVFETTDPNKGWNGYYNDSACDPGVFVYYLNLDCLDGQSYFKKGNITLIK